MKLNLDIPVHRVLKDMTHREFFLALGVIEAIHSEATAMDVAHSLRTMAAEYIQNSKESHNGEPER